jgi:hypothetical protein
VCVCVCTCVGLCVCGCVSDCVYLQTSLGPRGSHFRTDTLKDKRGRCWRSFQQPKLDPGHTLNNISSQTRALSSVNDIQACTPRPLRKEYGSLLSGRIPSKNLQRAAISGVTFPPLCGWAQITHRYTEVHTAGKQTSDVEEWIVLIL